MSHYVNIATAFYEADCPISQLVAHANYHATYHGLKSSSDVQIKITRDDLSNYLPHPFISATHPTTLIKVEYLAVFATKEEAVAWKLAQ